MNIFLLSALLSFILRKDMQITTCLYQLKNFDCCTLSKLYSCFEERLSVTTLRSFFSKTYSLLPGIGTSALLAVICYFLGKAIPLVGGAVFGILLGMLISVFWKNKNTATPGIQFASKKILQTAVVLLGFSLPLTQLAQVGITSLPVILSTICASLVTAAILCKTIKIPSRIATLIGVGSSICGGSAIAATAPVIKATDQEIAHAISVVFLFNVLAALIFPTLGDFLYMTNDGFGLFAGTAINDTSSVAAAAAVWDGMHEGSNALDYATIVKLTRTLAIIPITFILALIVSSHDEKEATINSENLALQKSSPRATEHSSKAFKRSTVKTKNSFSLKRALPTFIVLFVAASLIATLTEFFGIDPALFNPLKELSKFLIIVAMVAIGLNTNIVSLIKSGAKPIVLGATCWIAIACVSLAAQHFLGLW